MTKAVKKPRPLIKAKFSWSEIELNNEFAIIYGLPLISCFSRSWAMVTSLSKEPCRHRINFDLAASVKPRIEMGQYQALYNDR